MRKLPSSMRHTPFVDNLDLTWHRVESGYSKASTQIAEKLLNNYGTVHGGAIFTMADACSGAAAFFALGEDELCKTIEMKINYFKPAISGELTCEARVVNKSSNLATVEAEVTSEGRLIAKSLGTFFIMKIESEIKGQGESV